jgi:outer membrane protein assembly factor BamB
LALPRRWTAALLAVVTTVAAVTVVVVVTRDGSHQGCRVATVLPADSPLLDTGGMAEQPDERLDTLAAAVDKLGAPFGPVRAGVGYDYDQWLHLYGVTGGVLAWTKNNAPVSYLEDGTLTPRWSLRPATKRTAWDASADRFLLLGLAGKRSTQVGSFDLATGKQVWCAELAPEHRNGDPVATAFLDGGDVLTALPAEHGIVLTRLGASHGRQVWQRTVTGIDRADFLAPLSTGVVLAGGTEEFRLADPAVKQPGGSVLTAFSAKDASTVWSWGAGPDTVAHVIGIAGEQVLFELRSAGGLQLVSLSASDGSVRWQRPLPEAAYSSTLRGDTVLVKSAAELVAFDAASGDRRWSREIPTDRTYFPYGFTLGQLPSLDETHVLLPTTTSLQVLDLETGEHLDYALPVDGVSTTYWPYQLLVTAKLLGVVTNTGGILADRDVGAVG